MTDTPPGQGRSRRNRTAPHRVMRSALGFVVLLAIAIAIAGLGGFLMTALAPASTDKKAPTVLVRVPPGASDHAIGEILARKGLIKKAIGFVFAARLAGLSGKMHAGVYEISPAMPPRQIAVLMELGVTSAEVVTIPEGFTVRQVAERLAKKGIVDEERFMMLCKTQGRTFDVDGWKPPNASLEGYLFPDTYTIPKGTSDREIAMMMLRSFARQVLPLYRRQPKKSDLESVITLASLVEKEAEVPQDRAPIAGALTNRLRINMRLECDATIEYALPEHKQRLYYKDLRVLSPYNTYLHAGLPPTPIANPGLPSIQAALQPSHDDFLFYVAKPDGSHVFSRTLAEHDRAIAAIRAMRPRG